jgi:ribosome maturation factor RimP
MAISVDAVRAVAEPIVAGAGMDVEEVQVTKAGKREKLVIIVDADGGVDLDAVAEVSSAISLALDDHADIAAGAYVLEVTSPGVDRPLTEPRHWRRAKDRLVAVELSDGTSVTGRVAGSDEGSATLVVDEGERTVNLTDVERAVVQVEFTAPPATGGE